VTVFGEDVDRDKFDVEWLWDCCKLRASARIRAISLLVKPAGMGATGRERGSTAGGVEDRERRRRATISASGSSVTKGSWSVETPESWVASKEFGSKGVTFVSEPAFPKSVEKGKVDLGLARLRRSRTKATVPITARIAPAPPMMPPTIAPVFCFLCGVGVLVVSLAFIVSTGALRGS
jgi:hypothetical protein